jgi:hypothetical protein
MEESPYTAIPFGDRVFYFYEAYEARSARVHKDKVGVIKFQDAYTAHMCSKFIQKFNALPGLRFIRVVACGECMALINVRKLGDHKWNFK